MPNERVTYTEYIVRISAPKATQKNSVLAIKEFSQVIHDGIGCAINAAAQRALRRYIRAGNLHPTFTADTR